MAKLGKEGFAEEALPHLESVYRFALRRVGGNEAEAEDLAQDTFLRAYRSWESFQRGSNLRAWLFAICRNRHLELMRRAGRRPREVSESELESTPSDFALRNAWEEDPGSRDPEEELFRGIVDQEVLRAVDGLPEVFREVVVLADLEGLDYTEIQNVLDLPRGTVKSRLFRGRRLLHDALYAYAVEMGRMRPEGR